MFSVRKKEGNGFSSCHKPFIIAEGNCAHNLVVQSKTFNIAYSGKELLQIDVVLLHKPVFKGNFTDIYEIIPKSRENYQKILQLKQLKKLFENLIHFIRC